MTQTPTVQARDITLLELETDFALEWVEDEQFFREWQDNLPFISHHFISSLKSRYKWMLMMRE